ncbi:hypothetical protein [Bradyrhizobium sp. STM 3557]|uniref:hypothetical protein n=1 Tax=Bradyrhizobium sp. STM 3557 TaxID=578920 RepID=UPI00388EE270
MNWELVKPWAAQIARDTLRTLGMALASYGIIKDGAGVEAFIGAGMTLAGIFWGWFTTTGYLQIEGLLKKLTATRTAKDAAVAAEVLPHAAAVDSGSKAAAVRSVTGSVATVLLVAFALSFLLASAGGAMAQAARRPAAAQQQGPVLTGDLIQDAKNGFKGDPATGVQLTGNLKKDALAVWQKIQQASHDDLVYASLMAGAANTPASKTRKQCWDAIIAINEQANGKGLKNADGTDAAKPDPSLFSDIETSAEIVDSLSPQGPLYTSCAGAAQLFQANVIQFISAAVAGVAGMAKLAPIPGLM